MTRPLVTSLLLGALLAIGAVPSAGCKKDQSTTGEAAQEASSGFAKGFNALIDRPQKLIKTYFTAIPDEGPAADSKPKLFPEQNFAARSIEEAKQAFAAAKTSVPSSLAALPPLADRALAAGEKLVTAYGAAQKYYDAEDYKDDAFAKGKELHAAMLAARGEFSSAIDAMSKALDGVEDAQAEDALKKYGKDTHGYWFRFFNQRAKAFISPVGDATDPAAVLAAASAAFAGLDEAHVGLVAFATANAARSQATFTSYVNQAERFHSNAKKLQRMATEKPDDQALTNTVNATIQNYNTLVELTSSLTQLESQGLLIKK